MEYNIDDYTEEELYNVLNLMPSVSDVELEAKIIENIKKYTNDKNIQHFFIQIYDYFFEEHELLFQKHESLIENLANMTSSNTTNIGPASDTVKTVALTNPLNYSKDNLNPLLNQTIKRIISIDSQYRSSQYPYSTQFTFDLSDPLKDVLSLKLYSVQIPYTWYTINKDYGSNFIYLKGTSAGINNGNHDYIIDISAGNYNATNLVSAVSSAIAKNKTLYPDVSFGITDISYNTFTSLATLTIDLKKTFTETNYQLYFPSFQNPILYPSPQQRAYSIPSYLGFDTQTIPINIIYSDKNILPNIASTAIGDANNNIYAVYSTTTLTQTKNNSFNIIQYTGTILYDSNNNAYITSETDPLSTILQTIPITLTLTDGNYSRNQIQANLLEQLQTNTYLYQSSIVRLDRTDVPTYSYYEMILELNQNTTVNLPNAKLAVSFPNETTNTSFPIWTGTNSCFYFDTSYVEVSNLLAEAPLLTSSFSAQHATIELQTTQAGYDISANYYYITVANSPSVVGYTLDEYISAINTAFANANITYNNNLQNSGITLVNSIPIITFDINTQFKTANYGIQFPNTVLNYFYGITYSGNLSVQSVFTGQLAVAGEYTIPINSITKQTIPSTLIEIYPVSVGNSHADPFIVPFVYTLSTNTTISPNPPTLIYTNAFDLQTDIQKSISIFLDQNGDNPLIGTILNTGVVSGGKFQITFTVNVFKNITQNGYTANLYDLSGNTRILAPLSSWSINLGFTNSSYILSQYSVLNEPYSQIQGTISVIGETITLYDNSNNFFYFNPLPHAGTSSDCEFTFPW